jgi:hypothetical protein
MTAPAAVETPTMPEQPDQQPPKRPRGRPRIAADAGKSKQATWTPGPDQKDRMAKLKAKIVMSQNAMVRTALDRHLAARADGASYKDREQIPAAAKQAQWIPDAGQVDALAAAATEDGIAQTEVLRFAVEDFLTSWGA